MSYKHFNNNRKSHAKPKLNLEKLIKKIKEIIFLIKKFSISLIFLCILAFSYVFFYIFFCHMYANIVHR